jgi:hypothetical protein
MNLPVLKSHVMVARIIGLVAGEVEASNPLPGDKTDEELIRDFTGIGRDVHCLQIMRFVQSTYEFDGKTHVTQSYPIGKTSNYLIQRNPQAKITEKQRQIPTHKKYDGVLRVIGTAHKVVQPTAV